MHPSSPQTPSTAGDPQTEFAFSSAFRRPRARRRGAVRGTRLAASAPEAPRVTLAGASRRGGRARIAPPGRRIEIDEEAFRSSADPARSDASRSLVEAAVTLVATLAFGLGWAVLERGADPIDANGYAPAAVADSSSARGRTAEAPGELLLSTPPGEWAEGPEEGMNEGRWTGTYAPNESVSTR